VAKNARYAAYAESRHAICCYPQGVDGA